MLLPPLSNTPVTGQWSVTGKTWRGECVGGEGRGEGEKWKKEMIEGVRMEGRREGGMERETARRTMEVKRVR